MLHNDERLADILPSWPAETVLPSPLTIDSLALEVEPFTLNSLNCKDSMMPTGPLLFDLTHHPEI